MQRARGAKKLCLVLPFFVLVHVCNKDYISWEKNIIAGNRDINPKLKNRDIHFSLKCAGLFQYPLL